MSALLASLTSLLSSPAAFASPSLALRASLLSQLASLYAQQLSASAASQLLPPSALLSVLPSLLTTGFTVDQIFEQWQMLQRPLTERVRHVVSDVLMQSEARREQRKEQARRDEEKEAGEGDEEDLENDDVDGEDGMDGEEEEEEDDVEEGGLGDEEAEMEARLDAIEKGGGQEEDDDEEGGGAHETNGDGEQEEQEEEDEGEEKEAESQRGQLPVPGRRTKRPAASSAAAARAASEDAFFSLDQMDRFADHYEDIDNRAADDDEEQTTVASSDEWDDEVDLDADVGEVELGGGERYDEFFDTPTEEELKGQSISDMHRQEDEEDEDEGAPRRRQDEYGDEEDEGEEGEMEVDVDDDGAVAAVEGDEFGGFFARLASHRRASDKKAAPQQSSQDASQPPSDSTSGAPDAPLSAFARQQAALSSTLQQLEQQLITPKPWYHRGEVSATDRPSDSLLTTDLQVESNVKQREVMTRAVNESIEEIVRRRVSEGRYDDPVRRTAVRAKPYKVREGAEVSGEKSALGLGQLYEEQYMEQKAREDAAASGAAGATAADGSSGGAKPPPKSKAQQERDKQVGEIRSLFASLVADLSALSQYAYVPAERSEVRIVRDRDEADVLQSEEVGIDFESGVREARSVNEVMRGKRGGEMVGEGERQQVERKRRRRQMKERGVKRNKAQAVEERDRQLAAGVNGIGTRKVLSQDELRKALQAGNVKKGTVAGGAATAGGGKGGGQNKSGKFFSELQQKVAAVEADARREGMLK